MVRLTRARPVSPVAASRDTEWFKAFSFRPET